MSDKKRGMRFIETVGVGPVTEDCRRGPQFMESAVSMNVSGLRKTRKNASS